MTGDQDRFPITVSREVMPRAWAWAWAGSRSLLSMRQERRQSPSSSRSLYYEHSILSLSNSRLFLSFYTLSCENCSFLRCLSGRKLICHI